MDYYTITGTPTLWFNGTTTLVGAGTSTATGEQYMDIIRGRYFNAAPIRIDVEFNSDTGATVATVTMYSTTFELLDNDIHLVLTEDDVTSTYTHVTRDVFSDSISLNGATNTAVFNTTFTLDGAWNNANLRVVAFVQLDDKEIVQAGSSDPAPDFKVRAMVPFSRNSIGASTGVNETEAMTVLNTGLPEDFDIDLVVDYAPPGWTAAFKDQVGTVHTDPHSFALSTDDSTTFSAVITPASPGYMEYHFVITSPNLSQPLEIPFVYVTDDVDVLVVDDDGGENFEDYLADALDAAGKSYGIWNRGSDALTPDVAQTFDVLVWSTGLASPTLDPDDKVFLGNYLDSGKALFLTGQDVGWDLNDANPDPVWYQTYLHANWIRDDTNITDLDGVAGDIVSDGMMLTIIGGTGASNQEYPDEIEAADADATEIFYYAGGAGYCGATRSIDSTSGARLVYLGFGFEGIADAQDRGDLMAAVIAFIGPDLFADGFESTDTSAWSNSVP